MNEDVDISFNQINLNLISEHIYLQRYLFEKFRNYFRFCCVCKPLWDRTINYFFFGCCWNKINKKIIWSFKIVMLLLLLLLFIQHSDPTGRALPHVGDLWAPWLWQGVLLQTTGGRISEFLWLRVSRPTEQIILA